MPLDTSSLSFQQFAGAMLLLAFGAGCSGPVEDSASKGTSGDKQSWPRHVIAENIFSMTAVAADFTGDTLPDVIAATDNGISLYAAPEWKPVAIGDRDFPNGLIHSAVMDVDADGDPDFIGAVYSPGPIFWLERPPNPLSDPWAFHMIDDQVNGIHGLTTGDVDGDGKTDLAGNSAQPKDPHPESLAWYSIPPDPRNAEQWVRHIFADRDAPGLSHYLGLGDVNGDGRTDAASAAKIPPDGNWFAWWEQPADGGLPWKKHVLATDQEGATNILMADVNGDGQMDFIATRGHGQGVLWFEAPAFTLHEINADLKSPHCLDVGDIDEDGDVDAVTCAYESKIAAWFENDGKGHFTTHVIHDDQAAYDIRLTDMDRDSDLDVLIAGQDSRNIVWYENRLGEWSGPAPGSSRCFGLRIDQPQF